MPVNASHGVFPSQSAIRSKSSPDLARLYFRTAQREEFSWRTLPPEDRAENFDSVHSIGKRTTKYMKYQKKTAPLVDRTACKYNQEYIARPLGDYETNKELALTFSGAGKPKATMVFNAKSNYAETFRDHAESGQLAGAKQKSQAPKQVRTKTLGGTGGMLETESLAHRTFQVHPMELAKVTPAMVPKPNLTMAGQQINSLYTSTYNREYVESRVAPQNVRYEDFMPPAESMPFLADPSIFGVRRACFLSPGA